MALYLVQHGKANPKSEDPEQGLSPEGKADVERIASVAAGYKVRVSQIRHSGRKRALQTAEIMATWLVPGGGVLQMAGLDPLDDVTRLAGRTPSDDLMLVGHLPFMERYASYLITGAVERPVMRFQNGGIVCLDKDLQSGFWFIRWTLMPNIG